MYFGQRRNSASRPFFPAMGHPTHPTRHCPSAYSGFMGHLASSRKPYTSSSCQSMIGLTTRLAFKRQFSNSIRLSSLSLFRMIFLSFVTPNFSYTPRLFFLACDSAHLTPVHINRFAPPLFPSKQNSSSGHDVSEASTSAVSDSTWKPSCPCM